MKNYKMIMKTLCWVILLSNVLCMVSCKKGFLEVTDNKELNRQAYVKDLNTMQEFLSGIYVFLSVNYEDGLVAAYPDLVADNLKPLLSGTQSLVSQYAWAQIPTDADSRSSPANLNMNTIWRGHYFIIRACNFVIEDAGKYRNENPSKADAILGQAYAIRAMIHFKLVNVFAQSYSFSSGASHPGIPYVTTSDITKPVNRQTVADVYDALIADLNTAISLLPTTSLDTRIINRKAARALLARAYLFKEDFENAKILSIELGNETPLMTRIGGYPVDIFKNKNPNETEVFFQIRPITGPQYNSQFFGYYLQGASISYAATNDIVSLLTENPQDIRSTWVINNAGEWNVTKFPKNVANETPAIVLPETAYYPSVIRSSELFLVAAEASAKTGDESTARNYLDAVRLRANPNVTPTLATGQVLLDAIYKERRKELCFEGLRMYDLQRWKLGVHRVDVHPGYTDAKNLPYPSPKAIAPIPLQDVKLAGLTQNASY